MDINSSAALQLTSVPQLNQLYPSPAVSINLMIESRRAVTNPYFPPPAIWLFVFIIVAYLDCAVPRRSNTSLLLPQAVHRPDCEGAVDEPCCPSAVDGPHSWTTITDPACPASFQKPGSILSRQTSRLQTQSPGLLLQESKEHQYIDLLFLPTMSPPLAPLQCSNMSITPFKFPRAQHSHPVRIGSQIDQHRSLVHAHTLSTCS